MLICACIVVVVVVVGNGCSAERFYSRTGVSPAVHKCKLNREDWRSDESPQHYAVARLRGVGKLFAAHIDGHILFEQHAHNTPVRVTVNITGGLANCTNGLYVMMFGRQGNAAASQGLHYDSRFHSYSTFDYGAHYTAHGSAAACVRHDGDLEPLHVSHNRQGNVHAQQLDNMIQLVGRRSIVGRPVHILLDSESSDEPQFDVVLAAGIIGWRHNSPSTAPASTPTLSDHRLGARAWTLLTVLSACIAVFGAHKYRRHAARCHSTAHMLNGNVRRVWLRRLQRLRLRWK